jgi:hypothetical protein
MYLACKDAVLSQLESVNAHLPENGAAQYIYIGISVTVNRLAQGVALPIGRVNNTIADGDTQRVILRRVLVDENGTENTMFDAYALAALEEFQARLCRAARLAIVV